VSLFRVASQAAWTSSSEVAIDESTIPHAKPTDHEQLEATRKGDPIPHHYIPRKPAPNCLLAWVMATKSTKTKLPFLLDAAFDFYQVSGRDACIEFRRNWTYQHPPHFVVDAAITGTCTFIYSSVLIFRGEFNQELAEHLCDWLVEQERAYVDQKSLAIEPEGRPLASL